MKFTCRKKIHVGTNRKYHREKNIWNPATCKACEKNKNIK